MFFHLIGLQKEFAKAFKVKERLFYVILDDILSEERLLCRQYNLYCCLAFINSFCNYIVQGSRERLKVVGAEYQTLIVVKFLNIHGFQRISLGAK